MAVQQYRRDIDGLRAIAVVAVVLFHAGFTAIGGGYVGVDVFFVISGFLITQIIRRETDAGRIDLLHFYERRIRRIMPALLMFFAVTLVVGILVLVPTDLVELGKEMIASLAFVSNVKFWRGADYWFTGMRPLLHTWSLSIEEQFYLFFPLMLALLARGGARLTRVIVIALTAISLVIAIIGVEFAPSVTFFLLPSRLWELAFGAILALDLVPRMRGQRFREGAAATGLTMVLFACLAYTERTPFPGLAALVPCFGTALLIQAGRDGQTTVGKLLGLPLLVGLGLISYSLYLYHYPALLVARELAGDEQLPVLWAVGAIAISILLALLSWKYVEQPFRDSRRVGRKALLAIVVPASALVAAGALAVIVTAGLPGQLTANQRSVLAAREDRDPRFTRCVDAHVSTIVGDPSCAVGDPAANSPDFVILGDSHAAAIASAIDPIATSLGRRGTLVSTAACPPLLGLPMTHLDRSGRTACVEKIEREIDSVARDTAVRTVFLTAYWPAYIREYGAHASDLIAPAVARTAAALRGKQLVLLYDRPVARIDLPRQLVVAERFGMAPPMLDRVGPAGFARVVPMLEQQGVRLVSLAPPLCPAKGDCPAVVDGRPVLTDSNHLADSVARRVVAPYLAGQDLFRSAPNGPPPNLEKRT